MKKYFAKLDGDIVGIDRYIAFHAESDQAALEFADQKAKENYSEYENPFDEDGSELFYADVTEYNPEIHDKYIGQNCFTYYK